jgi:hypothetical protein
LDRRGVTRSVIADHYISRRERAILLPDGTALRCHYCPRPAVARGWGWHRMFGVVPVFPRVFARCDHHDARPPEEPGDAG